MLSEFTTNPNATLQCLVGFSEDLSYTNQVNKIFMYSFQYHKQIFL